MAGGFQVEQAPRAMAASCLLHMAPSEKERERGKLADLNGAAGASLRLSLGVTPEGLLS